MITEAVITRYSVHFVNDGPFAGWAVFDAHRDEDVATGLTLDAARQEVLDLHAAEGAEGGTAPCSLCWYDVPDHACEEPVVTEADLAARHEYAMDGGNFHADGSPHTGDADGHHAPQEELGMRFWLIVAQRVTRLAEGWTTSRQVMSFGLPADVLGITGPAHAATLAADLIGLDFDAEDLYVTCTSPDDLTFAVALSGGEVSVRPIL